MKANRTLEELIKIYRDTHDENIKEKIIYSHLELVKKIAHSYNHGLANHYDDLVQVGCIGLINALDRFNPSYGTNFRTYAANLIVGEMKHYLRDYMPLIKMPRELLNLSVKMKQTHYDLALKLGKEPSKNELAEELGVTIDKINEALAAEQRVICISLDEEMNKKPELDQNISKIEQIEDKKYKSFQLVQEDRFILKDGIKKLKAQSRQVIEFVFYYDLTQNEISKKLGISQMQVSRRLKTALSELWKSLNTRVTPW